ncbi:PP2C family protein-serine/threonine phosphatase [Kitasatospora sp. NPDC005856]|uniref:PP2C family protein-serine/threonine phosphatase n=1 Tax=Kitasatospora sp. NPDC005856 TaxID=3154566 RepID=UPI0033EB64EC
MRRNTALVVAEAVRPTRDLDAALADGGFEVRHADPAELLARPLPPSEADADLVLVSASLGLRRVALLSRRLAPLAGHGTVLVFPQGDLSALEECVRGGFDYVIPPYLPSLLRSRLYSSAERGQLIGVVEAMAAEASLLGYERELSIAREIQAGFLPERLPAPPGWEFPFRFRPARHVSGDFYDGFEMPDGRSLGFVLADVCDKGVSAALFMALIRTLLRHTAEDAPPKAAHPSGAGAPPALSPGAGPLVRAVVNTNRYLARHHLRQGYFATLFFGVLDPANGSLLFINAGHNPPVLLRADGGRSLLRPTGPAVGMMADSAYSLGTVVLAPEDQLFLYTDGVPDARSAEREQFGMRRLFEVLDRPAASGHVLLDGVERALNRHVGTADQFDDITMLALRRGALPHG